MLQTTRTITRRTVARSTRPYSSPSAPRPAAVLPSAGDPTSRPSPPPAPAKAPAGVEEAGEAMKPQPFILRPLSRRYQLQTLSSPSPSSGTTTLHFLSPSSSTPRTLTLPNLFIRDASIHPAHVHPSSKQKLFRTTDVPLDGNLNGYGVHDVPGHGECLVTEWSTPLRNGSVPIEARKLAVVPVDFLSGIMTDSKDAREGRGVLPPAQPWDRKTLETSLHRQDYAGFQADDRALKSTLEALVRDGIVLLSGVPTDAKEGHQTELRKVVERIGSIRKTWYGDLWDVRAVEGSKNIAYTNLDLGLHMDLTHFDSPPRYQFLHSLQNSHVVGGLSYFVDAFALAAHLAQHSPSAFHTLCTEPVLFEYRNGGQHTRFSRPTFELEHGSAQSLHAVNYSPPFQGPLPLSQVSRSSDPSSDVESADTERLAGLHDALSQFAALCDGSSPPGSGPEAAAKETWRWEHQLEPGECVIFDNRRVLHARTGFEFTGEGAAAGRWLKGAYMDGDEVRSRLRVLKAQEREGAKKGRTLFV
ncbi:hypothetical protein JCM10213_009125 [Rhodosporidiobolus nylandii]